MTQAAQRRGRIAFLEDDDNHYRVLCRSLRRQIPELECVQYSSEREFMSALVEMRRDPPDLFVVDMMVVADRPQRNSTTSVIAQSDFFQAGARCINVVQNDVVLATVPVVVYSILSRPELVDDLSKLTRPVHLINKTEPFREVATTIRTEFLDATGRKRRA